MGRGAKEVVVKEMSEGRVDMWVAVNRRSGLKHDSQGTAENQWGWSGDEACSQRASWAPARTWVILGVKQKVMGRN